MKLGYVIAGIALLLIVGLAVWRRSPAPANGMKAFAGDKGAQQEAKDYFAIRDAMLERAPRMSEGELIDGIDGLFDERVRAIACQVYVLAGKKSEPALLKALDDRRCDASRVSAAGERDTPYQVITSTLAEIGSVAVIPRLADWRGSTDERKRRHAISCIAMVGLPESIDSTLAAIASAEEDERSWVYIGILRCKNPHDAYRAAVSAALAGVVEGRRDVKATFDDWNACSGLARLDPSAAKVSFLSSGSLDVDNPLLVPVLREINKGEIALPAEHADRFLQHEFENEHDRGNVRDECLVAIARTQGRGALPRIDAVIATGVRPSSRVADALELALGLPNRYDIGNDDRAFAELPKEIQHVSAVNALEGEVNNGGFSQYFFNSSGDHCSIALEALEVIGATHCAKALGDAIAIVGVNGASPSRDLRSEAIAELSKDDDERLNELSKVIWTGPEELGVLLVKYMEKHADLMRAHATPSKK